MSGSAVAISERDRVGAGVAMAFVGVMLPDGATEVTPAFSQAGQHFQTRLIQSLAAAGLNTTAAFIQRPVPSYPADRRLAFAGGPARIAGGFPGRMLPFFNFGALKTVTISVALFLNLLIWGWQHRRAKSRVILLYNLAAPPAVISIAAATLIRADVFAIVADLQIPGSGLISASFLRRLEFAMQVRALPYCRGLVVLTKRIAHDFAPGIPYLLMEGAVTGEAPGSEGTGIASNVVRRSGSMRSLDPEPTVLMYAGGLSELKGIPMLLRAMQLLRDREYRLWISGDGPLRTVVEEAARTDDRITYLGFSTYGDVLRRMREATILVNPHSAHLSSARYVFPSKLIEYLATGTVVVTTPSTPEVELEYGDVAFVTPFATPEALATTIERVASLSMQARMQRGTDAKRYVLSRKSWDVQGRRIAAFILESARGTGGANSSTRSSLISVGSPGI